MRHDIEFIRDIATSVLWRIDDEVARGVPFPEAKATAIKHASKSWKYMSPHTKDAVFKVCYSFAPSDLSKRTMRAVTDKLRNDVEEYRGKPMGRIERAFFNWTGMCFWV
ncbi:MAG: hypothetical protein CMJ42_08290 [Phyllobacteriaceae bacterium]|nr:hypothetical protein [Phyllobacteriaceae bacterium]MBA89765.1 hypothetical protein [Phyllobacteriaceae bacterium]